MITRNIVFLGLLLGLASTQVCAQVDRLNDVAITILITPASTVDTRVEAILTDSADLYLNQLGVTTVKSDERIRGDEPSRREIARLAGRGGSDFVLVGTYNPVPDSTDILVIGFTLYLVDPAIPVAIVREEVPIDLSLDRAISRMLGVLMQEAFAYLTSSDADVSITPEVADALMSTEQSDQADDDDPEQTSGLFPEDTDATTADPVVVASPRNALGPGLPDVAEFTAGYAPAFPIAAAADYFRFAHGIRAAARFNFGARSGVSAGVAGSAFMATASGVAASGELLIIPLAATLAVRSHPSPLGAYAEVAAGGALLRVTNPALGTLTKVIPYASSGVGVIVAIGAWVGINMGVQFDVAFEGSVLLMSFVPSVSLYLGF